MSDWGSITDVPGVLAGHASRAGDGWLTGVSVVIPPPGTVGSVDVRGGGPGTHETDALHPSTLVSTVDAVVLTGGSAFGLASAGGVQRWCVEQGRGFAAGPFDDPRSVLVPIVPAAAVFDLGRGGNVAAVPDAEMGYAAAVSAFSAASAVSPVSASGALSGTGSGSLSGAVGAGTGCRVAAQTRPGGSGTASRTLASTIPGVPVPDGIVVGALAIVNAAGSPFTAENGWYARPFLPDGLSVDDPGGVGQGEGGGASGGGSGASGGGSGASGGGSGASGGGSGASGGLASSDRGTRDDPSSGGPLPFTGGAGPSNTTLVVIATNAKLDVAQCFRTAVAGQDGIARALVPAHTMVDGDTVFALSTQQIEVELPALIQLQALAAEVALLAIVDALRHTAAAT